MKCEICGKTAHRHGTKGRSYCFEHERHAWEQVARTAKHKDAQNAIIGEEVKMEAHRMHLLRGY